MNIEKVNNLLAQLNEAQQEAVTAVDGSILVVAGAGSGKTRVITYRTAYLLLAAAAVPENILAVTFTNKAAQEMKNRIAALVNSEFPMPNVSTFHAFGSLFLRRHIPLLGYSRNYSILDEEDQLNVIRECARDLQLPEGRYDARELQQLLKWHKSKLHKPPVFDPHAESVLSLYTRKLKARNAVDFEDLLLLPLEILRQHRDITKRYQSQYRYVMVDEYQDTNEVQFDLLKALVGPEPNLLVVGDEDQSIYKFRGAKSENIQFFIRDFPQVRIIKLEQNYRSTKTIIKAAQAVISRNSSRIKKELWTDNEAGEPVEIYQAYDEYDEASYVSLRILGALNKVPAREIAVLYRANAQSRALEETFTKAQIPHKIVGSVGFYQRREIKDVICFLRLFADSQDTAALLRVINVPPRGVGKKMMEQLQLESEKEGMSLFDTALRSGGKNLGSFLQFFQPSLHRPAASQFLEQLLSRIGYPEYLRKEDSSKAEERMENISEFLAYLRENEEADDFDLARFLGDLPLQSRAEQEGDAVTLLTVHSAKGMEFRYLFVVGMEEGLFPHIRSDSPADLEEERRLFYVAMTRAKEKLVLCWAQKRGMFGSNHTNRPSRFLDEIPSWFKVQKLSERFALSHPVKPVAASEVTGSEFKVGSRIWHEKLGRGTVLSVEGMQGDYKLTIRFSDGVKKILTRYAPLRPE